MKEQTPQETPVTTPPCDCPECNPPNKPPCAYAERDPFHCDGLAEDEFDGVPVCFEHYSFRSHLKNDPTWA